jgi:hypothetical protein
MNTLYSWLIELLPDLPAKIGGDLRVLNQFCGALE